MRITRTVRWPVVVLYGAAVPERWWLGDRFADIFLILVDPSRRFVMPYKLSQFRVWRPIGYICICHSYVGWHCANRDARAHDASTVLVSGWCFGDVLAMPMTGP